MGCGGSKRDIKKELSDIVEADKKEYTRTKQAIESLDKETKIPHLLIELRSLGFVEIQGKDIGGIYNRLDKWLKATWGMRRLTDDLVPAKSGGDGGFFGNPDPIRFKVAPMKPWNELCDASYTCKNINPYASTKVGNRGKFKCHGDTSDGINNMGQLTMEISHFMTKECGWTLQVCDSENLGFWGEIREMQIKFRAPHPLNVIAPLIMIELRQVGYIELNGDNHDGIFQKLQTWFMENWKSQIGMRLKGICALQFEAPAFHSKGSEAENNMGRCTMEVVDFMVHTCGWSMVTCNSGNFGAKGDVREQQIVFRKDDMQIAQKHLMIEMRSLAEGGGYIEVNGLQRAADLESALDDFFLSTWNCKVYKPYALEDSRPFCDKKYTVPSGFYIRFKNNLANNLLKRTVELAQFLSKHGWALSLCNGGAIVPNPIQHPNKITREEQIKFTWNPNSDKAAAALLMVEFRAEPVRVQDPIPLKGWVEISGPNVDGVYERLHEFITSAMAGNQEPDVNYCDRLYSVPVFRMKETTTDFRCEDLGYAIKMEDRLQGESNLGKWTMRLCDFMVDHLGQWDLLVCNGGNKKLDFGITGMNTSRRNTAVASSAATAREVQLAFRRTTGMRLATMPAASASLLGRAPFKAPVYWKYESRHGQVGHDIVPGTPDELKMMQEVLDGTYMEKSTRDRKDTLADKFVAVKCLRSEHPQLWDMYARRRQVVIDAVAARPRDSTSASDFVKPKTMSACLGFHTKCIDPEGNPGNQVYLLHGTGPTAALGILSTSMKMNYAGKNAEAAGNTAEGAGNATESPMFGPGIYLAESSSKADEYAGDDRGGEYDGLFAFVVCRAVLGQPFIAEQAGNYEEKVTSGSYDSVIGDRERAAGTFREFVFFDEASIYPEYVLFYRRQYSGDAASSLSAEV